MLGNHMVDVPVGDANPELNLSRNVYASMLPMTVTDIGPGYVIGTERLITRQSGTFSFGQQPRPAIVSDGSKGCKQVDRATIELFDAEAVFVREWTVDSTKEFVIQLAAGQLAVATAPLPSGCTQLDATVSK